MRRLLRRVLPFAFPIIRAGAALWAWNHRDQVLDWAGFAARSVPKLQGEERADVILEGRLRARLAGDPRTRCADGLRVSVADGAATLSGLVEPGVHDAALAIAADTKGVVRVRDDLQDTGRRRSWGRADR
ncbi:hypothetical protein BH18ACT1_BH18ACT1_07560 [soil metagenome]